MDVCLDGDPELTEKVAVIRKIYQRLVTRDMMTMTGTQETLLENIE
jgi:hypothetical protein